MNSPHSDEEDTSLQDQEIIQQLRELHDDQPSAVSLRKELILQRLEQRQVRRRSVRQLSAAAATAALLLISWSAYRAGWFDDDRPLKDAFAVKTETLTDPAQRDVAPEEFRPDAVANPASEQIDPLAAFNASMDALENDLALMRLQRETALVRREVSEARKSVLEYTRRYAEFEYTREQLASR